VIVTAQKAIHVIATAENDWMVREDAGRELGHYPTRREAEAIGRKIAQKRGVELVVQHAAGKAQRSKPRKRWFARLFAR
jgi:hypothetical protein